MRTFKSFTREDVKEPVQPWDPRSEGEQRFKHLHNPVNHKNLVPGVTDQDHVFNGGTRKYDPPTASYEKGADVAAYDKGLTTEANLPPHLAKMFNAKGDFKDAKKNAIYKSMQDKMAKKDLGVDAKDHKSEYSKMRAGMGVDDKATTRKLVGERHLSPAEMKKREVIAKAMGRENPKMDMAKKMAIATAQAKKVAESVTLDEKVNSQAFVKKYRENEEDNMHSDNVVHLAKHFGNSSDQKQALEIKKQHDKEGGLSRELGAKRNALHDKLWKKAEPHFDKVDKMKAYRADRDKNMEEEVEQINEIGDTKRGQKLINKVHKRASERLGKAVAKGDAKNAKKYQEVGHQAWDRMPSNKYEEVEHMEEEVQIDELSKATLGSYVKKASHDVATKSAATARYADRANNVKDQMKKGDYSNYQQGKKDDATADKMFGKSWKRRQGIAKAVDKLTKESRELEEAKRGRPRKNPLPAGSSDKGEEEGGREHIIVQYRKAERMPEKEIEHNDNSKHSFPKAHYKKALDMHLTMRPAEKETFEKRLASSKASALSAVAGEPAPKPKPKITLGGKMQKEAKDLDTKNVKSLVKHDCATHVKHGKFGEGRCVPEMHTIEEISEGVGYVTHYDVLFEHGIEKDVPVESLKILASEEHGHMPKKSMKEALIGNQKNIDANHNNKIDAQDFKILKGKQKFKKFSKMKESSEANMQQDSLDKLKSDPLAGDELKKKTKLPPTQGNTPVGGDQNPTRVAGKYSMEEESLNNLYNSLSEENQAKFEELIETDPGFEQLLSFARKQGF